eukprot:203580_1
MTTELALSQNKFDELYQSHQESIQSGRNNNHLAQDLVYILGGIDKIVAHYIHTKDVELLNHSQIHQIQQLLQSQNNIVLSDRSNLTKIKSDPYNVDEYEEFRGIVTTLWLIWVWVQLLRELKNKKKMAQDYTDKVLNKINTTWITTDASINNKTNKGCYGLIVINTNKKVRYKKKEKIDTDDAQLGEMIGMKNILFLIKEKIIKQEKEFAIVCDCKNAIKIIIILYIINIRMNIKIKFQWIPGHTDNKFIYIVDTLAKEAANNWNLSTVKQTSTPPSFPSYSPLYYMFNIFK